MTTSAAGRVPDNAVTDQVRQGLSCRSCGAPLHGRFCSECGQPARTRVTLRAFFRRSLDEVFGVNSGVLYTLRSMFRPGVAVRDYLAGRTIRYTDPARYLLICAAVTSIITVSARIFDAEQHQIVSLDFPGVQPEDVTNANRIFVRWLNAFLVLSVPITAAFTRLFFRRERLHYAEHLVFGAYVFAQSLLLMTLTSIPLFLLLGDTESSRVAAAAVWFVTGTLFFMYASIDFFGGNRVWAGMRAAMALAFAGFLYPPLMALGIAAYVYLTR